MKILLYGGTFDPPHKGHLNNLAAAAARVMPDEIIVMPAGVPPHKEASSTPAALRLEMCGCFASLLGRPGVKRLSVSDWEIGEAAAGRKNYTVRTLQMLRAENPGAALYLSMGSDMLCTFTGWHRWQDILRLATLVVESRDIGDDAELAAAADALTGQGGSILFARAPAVPLASRQVREGLAEGADMRGFLPESVSAVIAREGLYHTEKGK